MKLKKQELKKRIEKKNQANRRESPKPELIFFKLITCEILEPSSIKKHNS